MGGTRLGAVRALTRGEGRWRRRPRTAVDIASGGISVARMSPLVIVLVISGKGLVGVNLQVIHSSEPRVVVVVGQVSLTDVPRGGSASVRWRRVLSTLLLDPGQEPLNLPVGRRQAAGFQQVFQGCAKLSALGERTKKGSKSPARETSPRGTVFRQRRIAIIRVAVALPATALGAGSGVEGLIRFGFELQSPGGKLLRKAEILRAPS